MLKNLGFVGAGRMAQAHAKAALKVGAEIKLVVNANRDSVNLREFLKLAPHAKTINSGWRHGNYGVDAWVVAAPWNVIPEMAPTLLACPLPMLIEKPISFHTNEFPSGEYEDNKFVSFNRRFYPPVRALRSAIERDSVKSVVVTISDMIQPIVVRHGRGVLPYAMEMWASHILDLLHYLFGHMEVVWHSVREAPGDYLNIEAILISVRNRIPIHLSINADDPSPVGLRVRMSDGTTHVLAPIERLTTYKGMEVVEDEGVRSYRAREIQQTVCANNGFKPGVYEQMHAFLHQDHVQLAAISDAHQTHNIIHALRKP
jgi:predicted dehydrogenase